MSDRFTNIESSLMGINGFRPESHVAQQSRRDKLRVPQTSTTSHHHIQDFSSTHSVNLPIRSYSGLSNPDLFQLRSFRNYDLLGDPTMFSSSSSDVHNNNNNLLFAQKECLVMNQESNRCEDESGRANLGSDPSDDTSFASSSHVVPSNFMVSSKVIHSQPSPCHWKEVGVGAQQNCEWISKFVNGSSSSCGGGGGGGEGGGCSNSNEACPLLVGENLPPPRYKEVDCSVSVVAHNEGYQDHVQSSFVNNHHQQGSDISDQKSFGEINFSTTPQMTNYQSNNMQQVRETSHGSWVDNGGNELVLLPTYGNHQTDDVESHQWSRRNFEGIVGDSTTQSLSLSLSSHHPHSELLAPHYGIRFASGNVQSRVGVSSGSQDMRSSKFGYYFQDHQASCSNREVGNTVDSFGGCSSYARLCTGPLGPFTGYATILKNSKFLRPSQQLLDEFCRVTAPKVVTSTSEMSERGFRDVAVSSDLMNVENECGRKDVNSGISSSTRSPKSYDEGKAGSGHCQSNLPEFQQKKSKLVCMQEEVCRKYKQYQQQMQMVISSFESVAGLDAATPYTSLALKTVSKHFRCLKNTIADHLRYIRKALGEDFSSLTSRTSSSKDDATIPRLSFNDHNLGKQTATGNSLGFLDSQQHVWRPQRGLPERSVAVLRAWLFEHFLHPYPTDTDKHMLATQAGLTRNQVSNWFINARVRVWKPMVEEMHLLETKASSETGMAKPNRRDSSGERVGEECSNKLMIDPVSSEGRESPTTMNAEVGESSRQQWHHDKRSRMECQIPTGLDGNLMGFIPYHQSALEIGGLGAVSLTLGLRHSSENAQQQQRQQQHEHQLGGHFGGQMFHDFVG